VSLLDKFSAWSDKRLRLSQIKILYQNQKAINFVKQEIGPGVEMGNSEAVRMAEDLEFFRLATGNHIIELSYTTILADPASSEMLQVNKALRVAYSGLLKGKQAIKAMMRDSAGENTPFETRFMPAVGWKQLGDSEWDAMLSEALENSR